MAERAVDRPHVEALQLSAPANASRCRILQVPGDAASQNKTPKSVRRENIKSEKWKPEIKKNGAGHVHAADGEHIGWGDCVWADVAARTNAADDDAQREKEIAGERGDEE
jgi:hypothetical protein